jgi:hypothetical protein
LEVKKVDLQIATIVGTSFGGSGTQKNIKMGSAPTLAN